MTTTSSQIIEVLDELCAKFGIVVDWTTANILPYAQDLCDRIVRYEIAKSIVAIVVSILVTILVWVVTAKIDDDGGQTAMEIVSVIATAIGIITIIFCAATIIRASFLPEAVIADYLRPYIC